MKTKIIACAVMQEELLAIVPEHAVAFEFITMGLHLHPQRLHAELKRLLQNVTGYDRVILGFGLCGGASNGLQAGTVPLSIPRVHDCIPTFLGANERFHQLRTANLGTFYLSGGWLEGEHSLLTDYERVAKKHGSQKALQAFRTIFDSYNRILYIRTGHPRERETVTKSRELAKLLQLKFEAIDGSPDLFKKIVNGPWDDRDFINLQPGETIREEIFLE